MRGELAAAFQAESLQDLAGGDALSFGINSVLFSGWFITWLVTMAVESLCWDEIHLFKSCAPERSWTNCWQIKPATISVRPARVAKVTGSFRMKWIKTSEINGERKTRLLTREALLLSVSAVDQNRNPAAISATPT